MRRPVIYDLWADIRFQWKVIDYFEFKGLYIDQLKQVQMFEISPIPANAAKSIAFFAYEL